MTALEAESDKGEKIKVVKKTVIPASPKEEGNLTGKKETFKNITDSDKSFKKSSTMKVKKAMALNVTPTPGLTTTPWGVMLKPVRRKKVTEEIKQELKPKQASIPMATDEQKKEIKPHFVELEGIELSTQRNVVVDQFHFDSIDTVKVKVSCCCIFCRLNTIFFTNPDFFVPETHKCFSHARTKEGETDTNNHIPFSIILACKLHRVFH